MRPLHWWSTLLEMQVWLSFPKSYVDIGIALTAEFQSWEVKHKDF